MLLEISTTILSLSLSFLIVTVTIMLYKSYLAETKEEEKECFKVDADKIGEYDLKKAFENISKTEKLIAQSNCVIEKQETTSAGQRPEDPVSIKRKRINVNHEIDPSPWIEKIEAMLDDKERNLKSDNKVFADHKIDRMRFKRLATKEQKERHVKLQELCKANGRKIFAQHVSRGAKGTR